MTCSFGQNSSGTQRRSLVSLGGCWEDKSGVKKCPRGFIIPQYITVIKCSISPGWPTVHTVAAFYICPLPWPSQRKTLFLRILKTDCGQLINAIQWEGMEVTLCHFSAEPDGGLPFSLAPGTRSEWSKRRLLWHSSVRVKGLCGHALWTSKILCYCKPLRSMHRLSPNHVLSRSYLIIFNLSNFLL